MKVPVHLNSVMDIEDRHLGAQGFDIGFNTNDDEPYSKMYINLQAIVAGRGLHFDIEVTFDKDGINVAVVDRVTKDLTAIASLGRWAKWGEFKTYVEWQRLLDEENDREREKARLALIEEDVAMQKMAIDLAMTVGNNVAGDMPHPGDGTWLYLEDSDYPKNDILGDPETD